MSFLKVILNGKGEGEGPHDMQFSVTLMRKSYLTLLFKRFFRELLIVSFKLFI